MHSRELVRTQRALDAVRFLEDAAGIAVHAPRLALLAPQWSAGGATVEAGLDEV